MSKFPSLSISLFHTFGDNVCEKSVLKTADAMVSGGLVSAGYDCLFLGDAIYAKRRAASGELMYDEEKFPCGIKALSDALHAKGIKLGALISAGSLTPNGAPGSHENEYHDVATLDSWGVDYLCYDVDNVTDKADKKALIRRIGMAARLTGKDMPFCVYSDVAELYKWVRSTGAAAFCNRKISSVAGISLPDETAAGYSADFCLNSLGDIVVTEQTTSSELRRALSLCAVMSSPVIVDCDVSALSAEKLDMLKNCDVISIAEDAELRPARRLAEGVYAKFLDEAKYALAFVNDSDENAVLNFYTYDFGLTRNCGYTCELSPVFETETIAADTCIIAKLPAREAALYRLDLKETL